MEIRIGYEQLKQREVDILYANSVGATVRWCVPLEKSRTPGECLLAMLHDYTAPTPFRTDEDGLVLIVEDARLAARLTAKLESLRTPS